MTPTKKSHIDFCKAIADGITQSLFETGEVTQLINRYLIPKEEYYCYALYDSLNNKAIYIGKGIKDRVKQHFICSDTSMKNSEFIRLKRLGRLSYCILFISKNEKDVLHFEKRVILEIKSNGNDLLNIIHAGISSKINKVHSVVHLINDIGRKVWMNDLQPIPDKKILTRMEALNILLGIAKEEIRTDLRLHNKFFYQNKPIERISAIA